MTLFFRTLFVAVLSLTAVAAQAEDSLCPDISELAKGTPGDIGGVQADIERLNLCVERAKLLKQLDDVMVQREQTLKKMREPDMLPTGSISTGLGAGIPPLPVGALPPLKGNGNVTPQDLKPGEVRVTGAAASPFEQAATAAPSWQIRKIWGQGAGMRAQISDSGSGTLLNVLKGDPLPDGAVVENVSVKGVTISRNGNITDLSWEQVNASAASSNAKVIP